MIDPTAPRHLVTAFGERFLITEPGSEIAEDIEVVAGLANGRDGAMHREHEGIARRSADVITFKRGRRWQHDIRMPRGRRPPAVVDDDCFRSLPRSPQTIQILMMMERVATGPVNQPNVRINRGATIEFIRAASLQQHVGNAGDRDRAICRIRRCRDFRAGQIHPRHTNAVQRTVAERKSTPWQTDAPKHCRKRDRRPIRLFTVMCALQ